MSVLSRPLPYSSENVVPFLDPTRLRRALEDADLRVLLMVAFHISCDRRWLSPKYRPRSDTRLIADESVGLTAEVQQEIRDGVAGLLVARAGTVPTLPQPEDSLLHEMLSFCHATPVAPEYAPMMREEMGLVSRTTTWLRQPDRAEMANQHVLIVGAGLSGVILGAQLLKLGIPFRIVESASEVGGTWRENRYPGCGVDTPNHAYCYSIGSRYAWTYYFSHREDVQDYLCRITDEFGVREHIQFSTKVVSAKWNAERHAWQISLQTPSGPEKIESRFLVSAVGQFGVPKMPNIPGLDDFKGVLFHSRNWPDDLDVTGKRIALIGTGATAMQVVPSIAGKVAQLDIFQRSPQWARPIPRYRDALTSNAQWLLEHVPFYAAWLRSTMLWRYGDGLLPYLRKDPAWPHPGRSLNAVNDRHRQEMTDYIAREFADRPDLIAKCTPSYPPYGKRILLDNGWYQSLLRPNVALVTEKITRLSESAVHTTDGQEHPADIVVLSTGYQITEMAAQLNISGVGAVGLRDAWGDDNATAYLGITVPDFPNFFIMQGPSTGLGHGGSQIFQAECQARYITTLLARLIERNGKTINVRRSVYDSYVERVDALHKDLIWTHPGMSTYYRNKHGRVVSVSPFSLVQYWHMTHDPDLADYAIIA